MGIDRNAFGGGLGGFDVYYRSRRGRADAQFVGVAKRLLRSSWTGVKWFRTSGVGRLDGSRIGSSRGARLDRSGGGDRSGFGLRWLDWGCG